MVSTTVSLSLILLSCRVPGPPTHKGYPFLLGEEHETSFRALVKALASSLVLVHPNFDKPFILFKDASDVIVGAILSQHDENKIKYPIEYYSKPYLRRSVKISVTERECLVIPLAIKKFRPFL